MLPQFLPIEPILECKSPEEVYAYLIDTNADIRTIFDVLIRANTELSMFVLVKIYCTNQTYWGEVDKKSIKTKYLTSLVNEKYNKFVLIQPRLGFIKQTKLFKFRKIQGLNVEEMSYDEFKNIFNIAFNRYERRLNVLKQYAPYRKNAVTEYLDVNKKDEAFNGQGMAFDNFEFGLVD